jgi:glutamyl-tRNA synthetase
LSVVVDDIEAGVTDIIRGDDLLDSVPRQALIYEALDQWKKIPRYTHLPLVIGEDGKRLAKRHGDTRVSMYRELGVPAERLRSLLAKWLGIEAGEALTTAEMLDRFDPARIPKGPIVFTSEHDRFLRAGAIRSSKL